MDGKIVVTMALHSLGEFGGVDENPAVMKHDGRI
jgi:hypothetical protein